MKGVMYIPEIGDKFRLTSPWTFGLYDEYRNRDVWDALGCDEDPAIHKMILARQAAADEMRKLWEEKVILVPHTFTNWEGRTIEHKRRELPPEYQDREQELRQIISDSDHRDVPVSVTLPKGTVLSVDRIYIRKGASDFSSLTFYVHECSLPELTPAKKGGGFKKGRKRFWAKLADVNRIRFETVEEVPA